MANRFPLIVNPDSKEIQEIKQNDNLDLTGNGIFAGGSLGSNGQVLTSNGTSVEWRTVTSSGGGGGGLDQNTTYIIETEEQTDGANLNLVAGGTGVGTIRVKFLDNDQLKFDAPNSLTISPSIKTGSITNSLLTNPSFNVSIDGVTQTVSLGGSFVIPIYGNVFTTATQTLSNKTLNNCLLSGAVNTFSSIPNSALLNSSININGTNVSLGGSITIAGGGGTADGNTTYTISAIDWSENGIDVPSKKALRLTGSDASTDNVVFVAGDRISLSRSGDEITITGTEVNTDTNTTYSVNADTLILNNQSAGARLNLVGGGTGNGNGITDRINFKNGTGVTVSSANADDITISIGQNVSSTSNVTFNDLTLTGGLTVAGALTYVNTTNLVVTDKTITIADGVTNSILANGSGILLGTSNINLTYNHDVSSWESTSNFNLVPTKTYRIGGTEVLSSTQVLGKSMPTGSVVGTIDTQTLNNKTLVNPVISSIINTGTVYFPAPSIADTLVGRNTSDTLTNKTISGNNNLITNIGNSSLANSTITINGTQVSLGGSITVTSQDPYSDEKAQDAVAASFTTGTHTGISFAYDDISGRINATVTGGGGGIAEVVSDTTPQLGGNLDLNNNNITGTGDINISGDIVGEGLKLSTNNATILGTPGTLGEIRQIGGAPFFYDGTSWREFFLINTTAVTQTADTDWDNTILRSTFDENIDDVRLGVTPENPQGAIITTSAVKVGTASLRLQNQYLRYPYRSEYDAFTGEWTLEGWFYFDTLPTSTGSLSDCLFGWYNSTYGDTNWMVGAANAVSGFVNFYWKNNASSTHGGGNGTLIGQYTNSEILQKWNHIAITREATDGSIHFYLNGVEHGSTSSNQIIDNDISIDTTHSLSLGYYQDYTDSRNFDGYVDDVRISTIARYTNNFTAPTTALPVTGSTTTIILPPTNKTGVITLGATPSWRGTSGVTVTQESSGTYRLTFTSAYSNADDYYVTATPMDTTGGAYVVANRTTTYVEFVLSSESTGSAVDAGSLAVQIINHD